MKQTAFLPTLPLLRTSKLNLNPSRATPLHLTPSSSSLNTPTCSLSSHLRQAALACAAVGLTMLPLRTMATTVNVNPTPDSPIFVSKASSDRLSTSLAVVGVAKSPIHDYSLSSEYTNPIQSEDPIEEARQELALATRLITAVMLGAIVGVERSATALNLGVRSVTLISLSSAVASVMAAGMEVIPPTFLAYPSLTVALPSITAGLFVYVAAKLRRPRPYNAGAMSCIVSLCVAMGTACGTGMSLMTVLSCLAAVYVMRRKYTSPLLRQRVTVAARTMRADIVAPRETYAEVTGSSSGAYSTSRRAEGVDG